MVNEGVEKERITHLIVRDFGLRNRDIVDRDDINFV